MLGGIGQLLREHLSVHATTYHLARKHADDIARSRFGPRIINLIADPDAGCDKLELIKYNRWEPDGITEFQEPLSESENHSNCWGTLLYLLGSMDTSRPRHTDVIDTLSFVDAHCEPCTTNGDVLLFYGSGSALFEELYGNPNDIKRKITLKHAGVRINTGTGEELLFHQDGNGGLYKLEELATVVQRRVQKSSPDAPQHYRVHTLGPFFNYNQGS